MFNIFLFVGILANVALVNVHGECPPPDATIKRIAKSIQDYAATKLCSPSIKPGSCPPKEKKEWNWYMTSLVPKYVDLLTKECGDKLPKTWKKDCTKIYDKCHTVSADFCDKKPQEKIMKCVKSKAMSLMFKYGAPAMGMCDCVDIKILENFDKYEDQIKKDIDAYIAFKKGSGC